MGANNEEAWKPKAGFTPSDKDEEKTEELEEALTEQKIELGAKNKEAGKMETRYLPPNPGG